MTDKLKAEALILIENFLKSKSYKSPQFLYSITLYIKHEKTPLKTYIKSIKKAIKELERHFDETYLLFFQYDNNKKLFEIFDNLTFLNYVDDLIYILTSNDYIKESDRINNLKTKIELGIERYFKHNKTHILSFSPTYNSFTILHNTKDCPLLKMMLQEILNKKLKKDKSYLKDLANIKTILKNFPLEIYSQNSKHLLDIQKSLFPQFDNIITEHKKEKVITQGQNSIESANLILHILE